MKVDSELSKRRAEAIAHVRRVVDIFVPAGQWKRNAMEILRQLDAEFVICNTGSDDPSAYSVQIGQAVPGDRSESGNVPGP